ncbi:MAG: hypothetical protein ACLQBK_14565 [Candidatus Sulfotelmatobacter sp.]
MTFAVPEYDAATPSVCVTNGTDALVEAGKETSVPSQLDNFWGLISFSGMSRTAVPVSAFVARSFSALSNVQAVLAGESRDVLHVWVMINEWIPSARKQIYSVQKMVMKQLEGLHFDFYVVDLPHGTRPQEMVSDIPVIFNRAEQNPASPDCSEQ